MNRYLPLLGIAASATAFAAPPSAMQDGLWEITTRTEILGAATQAQPVTTRACFTKQDVESENPAAPKDDKCGVKDYRTSGNRASWAIVCAGKENITGTGTVTFQGRQAYSGTAKLRMQPEGHAEIQMMNSYSAKRIGDCER